MYGPDRTGRANTTPTPLPQKTGALMAKTERLEIRTEDDFLDKIEKLAQASGITRSEVIHRAVGLYIQAYKEAEVGNVIQFVPENEATQFIPNQTSVRQSSSDP